MSYRTVSGPYDYEAEPTKGSRFVARVRPVSDPDAAMVLVRGMEDPAWDHCCWAWRLRSGPTRSWDAGEPRGSAGRPILAQIEGHALFDVAVVVLRHFGGTKLGVGGLIRAYGGTAGMALDRAPIVDVPDVVSLLVPYGWDDTQAVEAALLAAGAVTTHTDWGAGVVRHITVEVERAEALITNLRDRTSGRVLARPDETS